MSELPLSEHCLGSGIEHLTPGPLRDGNYLDVPRLDVDL
jgi:hypothetical protein